MLPAKKRLCTLQLNKATGSTKDAVFYLPPNVAKHRTRRFKNTEQELFNMCTKLGIDYKPPTSGENESATKQRRAELNKLLDETNIICDKKESFYLPIDVLKKRKHQFIETEKSLFDLCKESGIKYIPQEPSENKAMTKVDGIN